MHNAHLMHVRAAELLDYAIRQKFVSEGAAQAMEMLSRLSIQPKALAPGLNESNARFRARMNYGLFALACCPVPGPIVPCLCSKLYFVKKIRETQQMLANLDDSYNHYQGECMVRTQLELDGHDWQTWPHWLFRLKHVTHAALHGEYNLFGSSVKNRGVFDGHGTTLCRDVFDNVISSAPLSASDKEHRELLEYLYAQPVFKMQGTDKESTKSKCQKFFGAMAALALAFYTIGQKQ